MSDVSSYNQVELVKPPYPKEVGMAVENAKLDNFTIVNGGTPYFIIDGKKYIASKVGSVSLRRFAGRNNVKSSEPPYHSLRHGRQNMIVDEIINKITRRNNNQVDPWHKKGKKKVDGKEPGVANRLAIDLCRARIAREYNNQTGPDEYDQRPLATDASINSGTSQGSASIFSPKRKVSGIYERSIQQNKQFLQFQEMGLQQQEEQQQSRELGLTIDEKNLSIQTAIQKSQEKRLTIAKNQCTALESALRAERTRTLDQDIEVRIRTLEQDIQTGMVDVKNFSKEYSLLKQDFLKHCKCHPEMDQRDHNARRKSHQERIAARGDNIDSDSDESLDSQAPLINEIEALKALVKYSKNRLAANEESLRAEKIRKTDKETFCFGGCTRGCTL
jgi:hypothetical protein